MRSHLPSPRSPTRRCGWSRRLSEKVRPVGPLKPLMQNAPLETGCAGLGLIDSMTLSRTWISEPQCTEHSLQVLGTIVASPTDAPLDLSMIASPRLFSVGRVL